MCRLANVPGGAQTARSVQCHWLSGVWIHRWPQGAVAYISETAKGQSGVMVKSIPLPVAGTRRARRHLPLVIEGTLWCVLSALGWLAFFALLVLVAVLTGGVPM